MAHCQNCTRSGADPSATNDPVKIFRCTSCTQVYYCDKACQKADWPQHQTWCKAHTATRSCTICIDISSCSNAIVLHSSALKDLQTLSTLKMDGRFLIVAHSPFPHHVDKKMVAYVHSEGTWSDTFDIIIMGRKTIRCGHWFSMKNNLALSFKKASDEPECCVCYEKKAHNVSCGQCKEIICESCAEESATHNDGDLLCPMCRTHFLRIPRSE